METSIPEKHMQFKDKIKKLLKRMMKQWQLYVLLLPAILIFFIFNYMPMYGVQIAFRNFTPSKGIVGSDWVGLTHFMRFFKGPFFWDILWNTISISLYSLIAGFPIPIILALALNEIRNGRFKKIVQTVTYAPHFISTVVICGMLITFLAPSSGIVNKLIVLMGGSPISFIDSPKWFSSVFVWSGIWQGAGWGSVIYLAALAGVDSELHEAAMIDGASRCQRIWYINLPHIFPIMVISLILNCGNLLALGYEKIYLLQTPLNADISEVISTYVYKTGLQNAQYSFASAVGLFNSLVNLILIIVVNSFAKRVSENSLW